MIWYLLPSHLTDTAQQDNTLYPHMCLFLPVPGTVQQDVLFVTDWRGGAIVRVTQKDLQAAAAAVAEVGVCVCVCVCVCVFVFVLCACVFACVCVCDALHVDRERRRRKVV